MRTEQRHHSDMAIPPGEYLAEAIEDLGMSQAELARRMGRPPQTINEIIQGHKSITSDTALQLERVTGVSADIWLGLEDDYRLALAREEEQKELDAEVDQVDLGLYGAMAKLGWVRSTRDRHEKVVELRKFFAVASLRFLANVRTYSSAFRVSDMAPASSLPLAAWLRRTEIEAKAIATEPYEQAELREVLGKLRDLTRLEARRSIPQATKLLAECGVALVILPHLPKTYVSGATFWASPEKAVVVLSNRGRWADLFWFNLFHELGHVLLHGKSYPILTPESGKQKIDDPKWKAQEEEANRFAADQLIPPGPLADFKDRSTLSSVSLQAFAEEIGVHPGIVVGRLQHDGLIGHQNMNELRERYELIL